MKAIQFHDFSKKEIKIFSAIGLLYILFFFLRIISGHYYLPDSYEYLEVAKIINSFSYFNIPSEPALITKRPFVYPLFLSFFNNIPTIVILFVQTLISLFSVYVFFNILKKLEVKISFLIVLIFLFTPSIFIYTQLLMSEWLVLLQLNLMMFFLLGPFTKKSFLIIQLITILLAFTKPVFYPFIYLNFIFFSIYFIKIKQFNILIFLPLLILQIYLFHNEQKTGFKHFSSIENHNLINYNLYYYKSSKLGKEEAEKWQKSIYENKNFINKSFKEQNQYLQNCAKKEIKNNLFSYSYYHFKTAIRGIFDPGRFDIMTFLKKEDGKQGFLELLNGNSSMQSFFNNKTILILILIIPVFLLNILKIFYLCKYLLNHKHSIFIYYILCLLFYTILITGPVNSSRYMMPFQMIIIGFALKEFQKKSLHSSNRQSVSYGQ